MRFEYVQFYKGSPEVNDFMRYDTVTEMAGRLQHELDALPPEWDQIEVYLVDEDGNRLDDQVVGSVGRDPIE